MNLNERTLVITRIARENPKIGKTAMMKCLYLLQTIEKVPLDYSFRIYTYGPYSSLAMDEIDYASQNGYIVISGMNYQVGFGYSITCSAAGEKFLDNSSALEPYAAMITCIIETFAAKTAKELELLSTIVYIVCMYNQNHWDMSENEICKSVQEIKPHFTLEDIELEYRFLDDNNYLLKAVQ